MDCFVSMALGCGLRYAEIAGLKWKCVDLDEAGAVSVEKIAVELPKGTKLSDGSVLERPTIVLDEPKTRASIRRVPMPAFVRDALRRQRASIRLPSQLGCSTVVRLGIPMAPQETLLPLVSIGISTDVHATADQ